MKISLATERTARYSITKVTEKTSSINEKDYLSIEFTDIATGEKVYDNLSFISINLKYLLDMFGYVGNKFTFDTDALVGREVNLTLHRVTYAGNEYWVIKRIGE